MIKTNKFLSAGDFRKSLEVRLQKQARETEVDLQRARRKLAFDRLLARFFIHPEPPFFLKGGYAMELRLSTARAPAPLVRMISIEQQFAEKVHAYTLPRGERLNSRVKDLIDILLLIQMRRVDPDHLALTLHQVFKIRKTHPLPSELPSPPIEWTAPYAALAEECGVEKNLPSAFQTVAFMYSNLIKAGAIK